MNLHLELLGAPMAAGLLVVSTHVLLGRRVLERGIIFIDLAIAQVAALGAVAASVAGWPDEGWVTHLAAGGAALAAAALLAWTERRLGRLQEAIIGSLYVLAACGALLLLANHPHGAEQMQTLLAGQVLWVDWNHLWPVAVLYAVLLVAWAAGARTRPWAFYIVFALAVIASVELVGVFLVFATLILPALAVHGWTGPRGLAAGYALGVAGYGLGLGLSVPLDLPAGPLVVCLLTALTLLTATGRALLRRK